MSKVKKPKLTERELKVLDFMAHGFMTREIGEKLGVAMRTVEDARSKIVEKLEAINSVEAVAKGVSKGLIKYNRKKSIGYVAKSVSKK